MKSDLEVGRYALRTFDIHYDSSLDVPFLPFLGPMAQWVGNAHCWLDGTCTAQCLRDAYGITRRDARTGAFLPAPYFHAAPHRACSCGIYGALDYKCLNEQYDAGSRIVAVIAAEGATIIGTRGLRTQYARVVGYWASDLYAELARKQFKDANEFEDIRSLLDAFHLPGNLKIKASHTRGHRYWI